MMALCPEAVDMAQHANNKGWYTKTASEASAELGAQGRDAILTRLLSILV